MNNNYLIRLSVTAIVFLFASMLACNDKGVDPKPIPPIDYPVYFSESGLTPQLYIYHPVTRQVDSVFIPWNPRNGVTVSADGGVAHVIPSIDKSKWFLYLSVATWTSAFEVYDVAMDSIIFSEILVPGSGQIAIDPEGKQVFYTNPGRSGTDPPVLPGFTIFDVDANQIDREVVDLDFFSGGTWKANPNAMAITPDGRWLSILGGSMALLSLFLYDIESGQLVHREPWGGNSHAFRNISAQRTK